MHVDLISHTVMPVHVCASAAHICTNADSQHKLPTDFSDDEAIKLVRNVLKMGHEAIAEHAYFTLRARGISRACSHQLVRYREASYAQQSQRYVELDNALGETCWVIPESIKQDRDKYLDMMWLLAEVERMYDDWLRDGVPAEDARFILPNAASTSLTITLNARELRHIMRQRLCSRAQWEIRELVTLMSEKVKGIAPVLFEGVGPACLTGPCPEGKLSCGKPWKG